VVAHNLDEVHTLLASALPAQGALLSRELVVGNRRRVVDAPVELLVAELLRRASLFEAEQVVVARQHIRVTVIQHHLEGVVEVVLVALHTVFEPVFLAGEPGAGLFGCLVLDVLLPELLELG